MSLYDLSWCRIPLHGWDDITRVSSGNMRSWGRQNPTAETSCFLSFVPTNVLPWQGKEFRLVIHRMNLIPEFRKYCSFIKPVTPDFHVFQTLFPTIFLSLNLYTIETLSNHHSKDNRSKFCMGIGNRHFQKETPRRILKLYALFMNLKRSLSCQRMSQLSSELSQIEPEIQPFLVTHGINFSVEYPHVREHALLGTPKPNRWNV